MTAEGRLSILYPRRQRLEAAIAGYGIEGRRMEFDHRVCRRLTVPAVGAGFFIHDIKDII